MTKQEVEHKIKDMLLKYPSLKDAEIEIIFKDKKDKKDAKYINKNKTKIREKIRESNF